MSHTRVYCRVYEADLAAWRAGREVDPAGRAVQAVTDRARAAFPQDDEEELEYAALWSAVEAKGDRAPNATNATDATDTAAANDVAAGTDPPVGLVVAALDVPAQWALPSGADDPDRGFEVRLDEPLSRARLVALHVLAADAGPDDELSWYDADELDSLAR